MSLMRAIPVLFVSTIVFFFVWPPALTAVFVAALGVWAFRQRDPGSLAFTQAMGFVFVVFLSGSLESGRSPVINAVVGPVMCPDGEIGSQAHTTEGIRGTARSYSPHCVGADGDEHPIGRGTYALLSMLMYGVLAIGLAGLSARVRPTAAGAARP